jgi:hypothetical protein
VTDDGTDPTAVGDRMLDVEKMDLGRFLEHAHVTDQMVYGTV